MELLKLLTDQKDDIVSKATEHTRFDGLKHYQSESIHVITERLAPLMDVFLTSLKERNVIPMVEYSETVARDRFSQGYPLDEVIAAYNILEEQLWETVKEQQHVDRQADNFSIISRIMGAGKTALADAYLSSTSSSKKKALLIDKLFGGTDGV